MFSRRPDCLVVSEPEGTLSFNREDMIRYAGHGQIIASGVVFRLLQRAFMDLSPQEPPSRKDILVLTAFPGEGVRDCIELVTRAVTDGRFTLDVNVAPSGAPSSPIGGGMYFEVGYRGKAFAYTFNPEIFDEHWYQSVQNFQDGCDSSENHGRYVSYKYGVLGELLAREDVFIDVHECCADRVLKIKSSTLK